MDSSKAKLFEPLKIGSMEVKNRIAMAPMGGLTLFQGWKWCPQAATYYIERAKNGCGLIFEGAEHITDLNGQGLWLYDLIEKEENFENIRKTMDEIHSYGTKFITQLSAGTGRSYTFNIDYLNGVDLVKALKAPSAVPSFWYPNMKCREITLKEIKDIIAAYARTASTLQKAGVDGIEVHALHEGYLLDSFAMANINSRTDEYGGSLENRLRFATDIIKAVKAACGQDFVVSVRFSICSKMKGYNSGALPGEAYVEFGRSMEEAPVIAKMLEDAGCDMLNADNGTYDAWYWAHPPVYMPMNCNLPYAAYIKKYVNIPVYCAGRMDDPELSLPVVENGDVDGITVGRGLLADVEWPTKVKEGRYDDIRPCIACHNGCFGRIFTGKEQSCALNPQTGHEDERRLTKAATKKKIAVIGGGIGGMEAARVCTLRGHDVTIYEKSDKLGGVFIAASAMSFKEMDRKLIEWYIKQIRDCNVDVRLNHEMNIDALNTLDADEIIIATGSTAEKKLPIKGIDGANVVSAVDVLLGKKQVGDSVIIVGGGLAGCEIAYELAKNGKKVAVIELLPDILLEFGLSKVNSNMLRDLFKFHDVRVEANANLREVTPTGIRFERDGESESIYADTVITAIGFNSGAPLADSYTGKASIHVIADASKIGNLLNTIWSAYDLCYRL